MALNSLWQFQDLRLLAHSLSNRLFKPLTAEFRNRQHKTSLQQGSKWWSWSCKGEDGELLQGPRESALGLCNICTHMPLVIYLLLICGISWNLALLLGEQVSTPELYPLPCVQLFNQQDKMYFLYPCYTAPSTVLTAASCSVNVPGLINTNGVYLNKLQLLWKTHCS